MESRATLSRASAIFILLAATYAAARPNVPARAAALRVCDDVADPGTLDPRRQFAEKNYTIIRQIFDSLVRFDSEGRIVPALAVSWRQIDPLTIEFQLRAGVRFHDGEPFDAQAVRFSLETLTAPDTGFPGAGFLNSVGRVEIVSPLIVRIHTNYPDGILLNRMAALVTILPPRYLAEHGADFATHPVGTGAFRFERWEKGKKIVLSANPNYWAGKPSLDRLEFLFLPVDKQVRGLLDGDVDVVTELPGTATLAVMKSGSAAVVKKESLYTAGSSINISSGPLADVRVRRALNYAIDKEMLVRYDLLGNGRPIATLTMNGEIGHDSSLKPYPYDPAKARELLKEAGYAEGLKLKVVVKAQGERTMKIIAEQLRRVGVSLEITPTTDATVIQDIRSRPWDFTFGNCSDPLSHSFFVQWIFISSKSPYSITRDPRYDELLDRMVTALDPLEQQKRGEELDRYVYDQALSLFTYKRIRTYGVRKNVEFSPSVTGMPYFYATRIANE
jgi:peptide/nickel transport system substrate-binding protein